MTKRAEDIIKASIGDGKNELLNVAIANAIYECAERLCTDWAELQHPADVLREIADEILELDPNKDSHFGNSLKSMEERIANLERQVEALNYVTDVSDYYE